VAVWVSAAIKFFGLYLGFFILERCLLSPRRVQKQQHWWPEVISLTILRFVVGLSFGLWLMQLLQSDSGLYPDIWRKLWQNNSVILNFAVTFFVYTFLQYWSHRWRHEWNWLWRLCHQTHHAPKRFDLSLTYYLHPFDVMHVTCVAFLAVGICGMDFRVLGLLGFLLGLLDKSQHLHVSTPRWLGYFIFRPEQHSLHHATHDNNYGLIPLWDQIFGTFKDCESEAESIGLGTSAQSQIWPLLFFQDVSPKENKNEPHRFQKSEPENRALANSGDDCYASSHQR